MGVWANYSCKTAFYDATRCRASMFFVNTPQIENGLLLQETTQFHTRIHTGHFECPAVFKIYCQATAAAHTWPILSLNLKCSKQNRRDQ